MANKNTVIVDDLDVEICRIVVGNMGICITDIAKRLNVKFARVRYRIVTLAEDGYLKLEKKRHNVMVSGNGLTYYVAKNGTPFNPDEVATVTE